MFSQVTPRMKQTTVFFLFYLFLQNCGQWTNHSIPSVPRQWGQHAESQHDTLEEPWQHLLCGMQTASRSAIPMTFRLSPLRIYRIWKQLWAGSPLALLTPGRWQGLAFCICNMGKKVLLNEKPKGLFGFLIPEEGNFKKKKGWQQKDAFKTWLLFSLFKVIF